VGDFACHAGPPRTHFRDKATWRVVANDLKAVALGADTVEVSLALRMALSVEGVESQRE
jgi:hypothetical protein